MNSFQGPSQSRIAAPRLDPMRAGLDRASELTEGADRRAIWIVAGFLVARLLFASLLGPGIDESYTLAIARSLSLSYFDHPPLHQWIAHFAALVFGEGVATRLPFIVLFAATGWIVYRLTDDLFGVRAATIALFSLECGSVFLRLRWDLGGARRTAPLRPGDRRLGARAVVFRRRPPAAPPSGGFGSSLGVGLGVAGLSKYTAALSAAGLLAFVLLAPKQRLWLNRPAPYVAAAIALAMVAPVLVWNAQHGWASFAIPGRARIAPRRPQARPGPLDGPWRGRLSVALDLRAPCRGPGGGLASAVGRAAAFPALSRLASHRPFHARRRSGAPEASPIGPCPAGSSPSRYGRVARRTRDRLQLVAPLGPCLCGPAGGRRHRVGRASLDRLAVAFGAVPAGLADPTLEALDWRELREAPALVPRPAFVISTTWSDAGKIALALGPAIPVFVISWDPRGWAFVDGRAGDPGRDGVLVTRTADLPAALAVVRPDFDFVGATQFSTLTRNGHREIELALVPVKGLTRELPIPIRTPPVRQRLIDPERDAAEWLQMQRGRNRTRPFRSSSRPIGNPPTSPCCSSGSRRRSKVCRGR